MKKISKQYSSSRVEPDHCYRVLYGLNWLSELLKLTLTPNSKPNPNPKYRIFETADLPNSGLFN